MSIGSIVLIVLAVVFILTAILPITRRIWVFHLFAWKAALLGIADLIGLRRLAALLAGRPYERTTFPMLARHFAEDMGPTFIKFGQIIASSTGVFPRRWSEEFQKCLDRVRPFAFADVQRILEAELGADASRLTALDAEPLASASVAQVHTATLLGGDEVVVKVQRPGIQARVAADMKIMRFIARCAELVIRDAELVNPVGIVEDFAETLREELDFRKE